MSARSFLYVPGDQAGKVEKAASRGADALILDLEDSVGSDRKDVARAIVADWLRGREEEGHPEVWVRVNRTSIAQDIEAVASPALRGVYLPKADRDGLQELAGVLTQAEGNLRMESGTVKIAALVESAAAVLDLREISTLRRVVRLAVGEVDLAAELGMDLGDGPELLPVRLLLVVVSAAARLEPPVGPVWTALSDADGLRESSHTFRRLGYAGRAAIHPAQVPVINEVFTPTSEEVEKARETLRRHEEAVASGSGVATDSQGGMIDEAIVRHARRVLGRARASTEGE